MEFITIFFIAVGLAMDAFSVSIVAGAVYRSRIKHSHVLRIAFAFGSFQGFMPIVGWLLGSRFKNIVEPYDYWIAFFILLAIGIKMIYDAYTKTHPHQKPDPTKLWVLLSLALATSIDAFAVGLTLSLVTHHIRLAVLIIALVTFIFSYAGVFIGKTLGHFFENKIEVAGGLILISIGIKILLQYLLSN